MNIRTCLRPATFAFGTLWFCVALSAQAATISVTYAISATGSGDPTNPPLFGNGTGSLVPLGSMTWRDMSFPDLATGANVGTFTMTFANGDTLVGTLQEQLDLASPPTAAAFTQTLYVTSGTGAFGWYNGTLTGNGTANLVAGPFSVSGSGMLNTTPEPGSLALLPLGLLCLVACRNRVLGSWSVGRQMDIKSSQPFAREHSGTTRPCPIGGFLRNQARENGVE